MVQKWYGNYSDSWKGVMCAGSFRHPNRIARKLISRIYRHLMSKYGLTPGHMIVDPFAGVGCTAIDAMFEGFYWFGVEADSKWVAYCGANMELWKKLEPLGYATVRQGDARRLGRLLPRILADAIVTCPPHPERPSNLPMGSNLDEYWRAMEQVVDQCCEFLRDQAVAVWIVRPWERSGQVINFPEEWVRMCEHGNWELVEVIESMYEEPKASQRPLFEGKPIPGKVAGRNRRRRGIQGECVMVMRKRKAGGIEARQEACEVEAATVGG